MLGNDLSKFERRKERTEECIVRVLHFEKLTIISRLKDNIDI